MAVSAVHVVGLAPLTASFIESSATARSKADAATSEAASSIAQAQRSSAPVNSGRTRGSISATPVAGGMSVGPTWFVARFLVFGTVNMSPKWNLFGASQAGIDTWQSKMSDIAGTL